MKILQTKRREQLTKRKPNLSLPKIWFFLVTNGDSQFFTGLRFAQVTTTNCKKISRALNSRPANNSSEAKSVVSHRVQSPSCLKGKIGRW